MYLEFDIVPNFKKEHACYKCGEKRLEWLNKKLKGISSKGELSYTPYLSLDISSIHKYINVYK